MIQSQAHSIEQKIVYLNLEKIIQNSSPGSLILKELQDIIKKKNILSKEEF